MPDGTTSLADRYISGLTSRLLELLGRPRTVISAALLAGMLFACWLLVSGSLTEETISRQWFYVPIAFGAIRFGALGAAVGAGLATLLAGPAVPVVGGHDIEVWGVRGLLFYFVGMAVAAMVGAHRRAIEATYEAEQARLELAVERNQLVQTVSHEFRTPLTVLSAGTRTLTSRRLEPEKQATLLEAMDRAAGRLRNLIEVVLAAVETSPEHRLPTTVADVEQLVGEVVGDLEHLDGGRRVRYDIAPGAKFASVPGAVRLLTFAVLENALKFSPASEPVELRWRHTTDEVEIEVQDHGPGIPDDLVEVAFQPFRQLDQSSTRDRQGLGMGLYTAHRLVERLGGELDLRTSSDGTTVVLRLPQRRDTDPASRSATPREDARGRATPPPLTTVADPQTDTTEAHVR